MPTRDPDQYEVVIVGAGPAGLTAAYLLTKQGKRVLVLEQDPHYVGGISRTVRYKGFHFDIGGHRFFSKSREVEQLWNELLPNDFLNRPRASRIFYRNKFFSYPLKAFEALFQLGVGESILCVLSYVKARLLPIKNPKNFEDWVSNKFGKRLFNIFFKTYTEKVWGMSCKDISADWAAQRIKGLSLSSAIRNALLPAPMESNQGDVVKTLISSFRYPRKGPGMMWEAAADKTRAQGGIIQMGAAVQSLKFSSTEPHWESQFLHAGQTKVVRSTHVICSAPMKEVLQRLEPAPKSRAVAGKLRYRDFITVALILKERDLFDDNWIYIHDPSVKVGRIQNFKSWSPEMVPDPALNCLGLEYFCFEGDGLWNSADADLIALGQRELVQLGLADKDDFVDACVVRQAKAYPVYDDDYAQHVDVIRKEVEVDYPGLHFVGRNGMHKYNNQDHAMMTAMLTVENIIAGTKNYDVWQVNEDAEYHEEGTQPQDPSSGSQGLRQVPKRV